MSEIQLPAYKAYLRLVDRHRTHLLDSCTYVPDTDEKLECPCFPYGLTDEMAEDYCRFAGVRRCPTSSTLHEREWCNNERSFEGAFRLRLI